MRTQNTLLGLGFLLLNFVTPIAESTVTSNHFIDTVSATQANDSENTWRRSVVSIANLKQLEDGSEDLDVFCSGTFIGENRILTAAHCLRGRSPSMNALENQADGKPSERLVIIFGESIHSHIHEIRETTALKAHDKFIKKPNDRNDLGLIEFFGDAPSTALAASFLDDFSILRSGQEVLLAGFGKVKPSDEKSTGTLREFLQPIAEKQHGRVELTIKIAGLGPCMGDSGGPAFVFHQGQYKLWGVISRGNSTCRSLTFVTPLNHYFDWLPPIPVTHKDQCLDSADIKR